MESLKALEAEKSGMGGGIGKQGAAAHQAKKDMAQAQAGEAAATRQAERLMEEWRELFTQSHACRGAAELAFAVLTLTLTLTLTLALTLTLSLTVTLTPIPHTHTLSATCCCTISYA